MDFQASMASKLRYRGLEVPITLVEIKSIKEKQQLVFGSMLRSLVKRLGFSSNENSPQIQNIQALNEEHDDYKFFDDIFQSYNIREDCDDDPIVFKAGLVYPIQAHSSGSTSMFEPGSGSYFNGARKVMDTQIQEEREGNDTKEKGHTNSKLFGIHLLSSAVHNKRGWVSTHMRKVFAATGITTSGLTTNRTTGSNNPGKSVFSTSHSFSTHSSLVYPITATLEPLNSDQNKKQSLKRWEYSYFPSLSWHDLISRSYGDIPRVPKNRCDKSNETSVSSKSHTGDGIWYKRGQFLDDNGLIYKSRLSQSVLNPFDINMAGTTQPTQTQKRLSEAIIKQRKVYNTSNNSSDEILYIENRNDLDNLDMYDCRDPLDTIPDNSNKDIHRFQFLAKKSHSLRRFKTISIRHLSPF